MYVFQSSSVQWRTIFFDHVFVNKAYSEYQGRHVCVCSVVHYPVVRIRPRFRATAQLRHISSRRRNGRRLFETRLNPLLCLPPLGCLGKCPLQAVQVCLFLAVERDATPGLLAAAACPVCQVNCTCVCGGAPFALESLCVASSDSRAQARIKVRLGPRTPYTQWAPFQLYLQKILTLHFKNCILILLFILVQNKK